MKFIIDHQLPPSLARFIETQGHTANHVRELGMQTSDDTAIWKHAVANHFVVVSKDEDFFFLACSPGATARLVWVRTGNCRAQYLIEQFRFRLPQIIASFEAGSNIVELR